MIGDIENGIIARINAAQESGVLGYQLRTLASYAGELDDLHHAIRNFPAGWVAFASARAVKVTTRRVKWQARFNFIVASTSLRNEKAARHGAIGKVGSYQMLLDFVGLLQGQTFGLEIDPLQPTDIRSLFQNRADRDLASIYGIELVTGFETDGDLDADGLDDFTTFHANWDVPVLGNVGNDGLPDDESADATDHVTLETSA